MTARSRPVGLTGLALLAATLALGGCAAKLPKLAVCDGKHRRDANPYGTVLPGAPPRVSPPPPGPAEAPPGKDPAAPPEAKTSAITPSASFSSC